MRLITLKEERVSVSVSVSERMNDIPFFFFSFYMRETKLTRERERMILKEGEIDR